ncbi:hypothetical protein ASALC70_02609 [Alcanivorax sp. ALC70]|nr:hypothetical protein ASALC70_02609 [Alcanivorax sp. ALC70]
MIKLTARTVLFSSVLAAFSLSGCALTDAEAEQALEIADSPSNLNTPQPDWDTPFWEPWSQAQADGNKGDQPRAVSFNRRDQPLANVALVTDGAVQAALPETLTKEAAEHGLLILPKGLVQDAIAHTSECNDLASQACRSALAVYPGSRLLVQARAGDGGRVAVRVWDTALDKELTERVANNDQGAARLLDSLASQAATADWSARPFQGEGNALYIAAGRVNGLAEGTVLEVREPGRPVRTPTGQVVAWRAGEVVGKAKVTEWVGATLSRIEPVSGTAPSPAHRLSLAP